MAQVEITNTTVITIKKQVIAELLQELWCSSPDVFTEILSDIVDLNTQGVDISGMDQLIVVPSEDGSGVSITVKN